MLKNKSCLIISATSDIGESIAKKFSKEGVSTLYLHGRNSNHLTTLSNDCIKNGSKCFNFNCDLCNSQQISKLKDDINKVINENSLDIFIFCAGGLGNMDPISFLKVEEDFLRIMQLNFLSCVELFEFIIPKLSSKSSAIFITSTNTFVPLECGSAYCTSKSSLKEYMKSKAVEIGSKGIRVNTIAPGLVETKFHKDYFDSNEELNTFFENCKKEHPLGRIATCEGIANTAMFLGSDLACDITGSETVIDCGETLCIKDKNFDDENEEEEEENEDV